MREILAAQKLFQAFYNVVHESPIDLIKLCDGLKFRVQMTDMNKPDGCHIRIQGKPVLILISKHQHWRRKRFTLAHEIGHILLGHRVHARLGDDIVDVQYARQEIEANRFAAELLLPTPELKRNGMLSAFMLSRRYGVSLEAAAIKARQLGWCDSPEKCPEQWKLEPLDAAS